MSNISYSPTFYSPVISKRILRLALYAAIGLAAFQVTSAISLGGKVSETNVSGFRASAITLGDAKEPSSAIYGISLAEHDNNPCQVKILKENVLNSNADTTATKNACGTQDTVNELTAQYSDFGSQGARVFVTGIQVVMNKEHTQVEGYRLKGQKVLANGTLANLNSEQGQVVKVGGASTTLDDVAQPIAMLSDADQNSWMEWAECPAGKLATAAVLHFEAGVAPRNLVGIGLKCQTVRQ